jgi:8-oxo-dGTP diphosphatase
MQIPPSAIAPDRPRTGVSVLVLRAREALLVRRAHEPYAGCWSLPGGSQELGETLEAAARRELAEETGLIATKLVFAEIVEPIIRAGDGTVLRHFVLALFKCNAFEGEPIAGDDASALGWFGFDAMDVLEMTPGTAALIKRLAQNHG